MTTTPTSADDALSHHGVIAVHIRELDQLFNSLDPSPFWQRGIDRAAEEFIVGSARDLPGRLPAALVVYVDGYQSLPEEPLVVGEAIHAHFARKSQMLRWEFRRLIRRGVISLCIGLAVLGAAVTGAEILTRILGGGHMAEVLGTSLHIGGWVAMWTPIEIFLYEWWPLLAERRVYDQLSRMPVHIVYAEHESPEATAASAHASRHQPAGG